MCLTGWYFDMGENSIFAFIYTLTGIVKMEMERSDRQFVDCTYWKNCLKQNELFFNSLTFNLATQQR